MDTAIQAEGADLVDAELLIEGAPIGIVVGLQRDPVSHRVQRIIATYGPRGRQVAVPIDWVTRGGSRNLVLRVDARLLDDLPDHLDVWRGTPPRPPLGPPQPAGPRP